MKSVLERGFSRSFGGQLSKEDPSGTNSQVEDKPGRQREGATTPLVVESSYKGPGVRSVEP